MKKTILSGIAALALDHFEVGSRDADASCWRHEAGRSPEKRIIRVSE